MAEGPDTPGMIEPGYVPPAERTVEPEGPEGYYEVGYTPTAAQEKVRRSRERGGVQGLPAPTPTVAPQGGVPAPTPPAAVTAPAMTKAGRDAWAFVQSELDLWGLGSLTDTMKDLIINGAGRDETMRVIRGTDTYKVRFAGMIARQKAGFNAITEDQYLGMEDQYRGVMRQYGFPEGLYDDPSDFATYIGNDLSLDEFNSRVAEGYQWAMEADPFEKAQLQALYGMTDGDFAAAALDPDKALPFLWQRKQATKIAAQASRTGWGQLTAAEAESLQNMGLSTEDAGKGFAGLQVAKPLFTQAVGEAAQPDFTREDQFGIAFGNDVVQQQRLSRRQRQRRNASLAGGGAVTTNAGATGLGSVS